MCILQIKSIVLLLIAIGFYELARDLLKLVPSLERVPDGEDFLIGL